MVLRFDGSARWFYFLERATREMERKIGCWWSRELPHSPLTSMRAWWGFLQSDNTPQTPFPYFSPLERLKILLYKFHLIWFPHKADESESRGQRNKNKATSYVLEKISVKKRACRLTDKSCWWVKSVAVKSRFQTEVASREVIEQLNG